MPTPICLHMQQSTGSNLERSPSGLEAPSKLRFRRSKGRPRTQRTRYGVVFACVRERGRGARRLGRTEAWSYCPVVVAAQEKGCDLGFVLV
ncbi:Uncharacterized protein F383_25016 [Gossypium arboreum]|uniref:Uncharacterized protein n=1 Tax=Gossypium arboreum TaxID=29729 RepID=A0A0B0P7A2_GOSAR|nr:Uncharacterized protein F383_25016 [Gossypium arboreum]